MTEQPYAEVARRAANQLQSLDDKLPGFVELALQGKEPPKTYSLAITIALASLVVSVAKFAYDVCKDLRSKPQAGSLQERIEAAVRLKVDVSESVTPVQHDRVIATVVAEILRE